MIMRRIYFILISQTTLRHKHKVHGKLPEDAEIAPLSLLGKHILSLRLLLWIFLHIL